MDIREVVREQKNFWTREDNELEDENDEVEIESGCSDKFGDDSNR